MALAAAGHLQAAIKLLRAFPRGELVGLSLDPRLQTLRPYVSRKLNSVAASTT
jgi:hypothetical protein